MKVDAIVSSINDQVEQLLKSYKKVNAEDIRLDRRCGQVWLGDEGIFIEKALAGPLDYYGGFEYVDKENRIELGDWVFYSINDSHVADQLDETEYTYSYDD